MTERRHKAPARRSATQDVEVLTRAAMSDGGDRLLKLTEVSQIAKIGKTTVYKLMAKGAFPQACKPLGSSSSRWSEREVTAWVAEQLAARAA